MTFWSEMINIKVWSASQVNRSSFTKQTENWIYSPGCIQYSELCGSQLSPLPALRKWLHYYYRNVTNTVRNISCENNCNNQRNMQKKINCTGNTQWYHFSVIATNSCFTKSNCQSPVCLCFLIDILWGNFGLKIYPNTIKIVLWPFESIRAMATAGIRQLCSLNELNVK